MKTPIQRRFILQQAVVLIAFSVFNLVCQAAEPEALFDGKGLSEWDFVVGGWEIESDGSMTCRMKEVKDKKGKTVVRGMGYAWPKKDIR